VKAVFIMASPAKGLQASASEALPRSGFPHFHNGSGQSVVQPIGHSARMSGGNGAIKGLIVVIPNGEGRGVACRVCKPIGEI
jgi:hypothetical protein